MITDLDCIKACVETYGDKPQSDFHFWFDGSKTDGVVFGVDTMTDCTLIAFRGSTVFLDWIRDFEAEMIHTSIGGVEKGFFDGLEECFAVVAGVAPKGNPIYVTGHSLGAGRAHIFAALLIKGGYNVEVVTFGSPRPGDAELAKILNPFPIRSYKNGPDYVCDVPLPLPLLPYDHPSKLIPLYEKPSADDEWGPLSWHHSQLYLQALKG